MRTLINDNLKKIVEKSSIPTARISRSLTNRSGKKLSHNYLSNCFYEKKIDDYVLAQLSILLNFDINEVVARMPVEEKPKDEKTEFMQIMRNMAADLHTIAEALK